MSDSDSFWLSLWEIVGSVGFLIVIVGVIGEGVELLAKWALKKKYRKFQKELNNGERWLLAILIKYVRSKILEIETIAFGLVVFGLALEFWGSHKAEIIANKANAELNLKAQQLENENLLLKLKSQPRIITDEQVKNFIFLTEEIPKVPIHVGVSELRDEVINYAYQIRKMLTEAKFKIPDSDRSINNPDGIVQREGVSHIYPLIKTEKKFTDLDFYYNSQNPLYSLQYGFHFEYTNGLIRPIIPESQIGDTNRIFAALNFCFHQIGITNTFALNTTNFINPGEFEIHVLSRP